MIRVPGVLPLLGLVIQCLPVQSRLRRVLVRRRVSQVYEAFNRRDMEAFLVLGSHPTVEVHTAADEAGVPFGVDLADVYRGHEGLAVLAQQWVAAWEDYTYAGRRYIETQTVSGTIAGHVVTGTISGRAKAVRPGGHVVRCTFGPQR